MEEAFATEKTIDKTCGICMENVWEKNARFGILQNCRHCFCLDCIRKWRQSQEMESQTVRSCPECRTHSHFVIPAAVWVDEGAEKEKLIEIYQQNMSKKVCKYFKPNDRDSCRFGNKCFYRHENRDGTVAECDSPSEISRRMRHRVPQLVEYFLDDRAYSSSDDDHEAEILAVMFNRQGGFGY
ncbi:hypothetical protein QR680_006666 [Steinernema hermaphroditum]|uniref:RING-type E3 ubiquitin transferase n=1 Tax=Steinernema hermaphroditum TaxID=289476 RepID=A0AA39HW81_9BILA|nr:hypothetical protein QR680_006666 [Steinernema hermaphroditum]